MSTAPRSFSQVIIWKQLKQGGDLVPSTVPTTEAVLTIYPLLDTKNNVTNMRTVVFSAVDERFLFKESLNPESDFHLTYTRNKQDKSKSYFEVIHTVTIKDKDGNSKRDTWNIFNLVCKNDPDGTQFESLFDYIDNCGKQKYIPALVVPEFRDLECRGL